MATFVPTVVAPRASLIRQFSELQDLLFGKLIYSYAQTPVSFQVRDFLIFFFSPVLENMPFATEHSKKQDFEPMCGTRGETA